MNVGRLVEKLWPWPTTGEDCCLYGSAVGGTGPQDVQLGGSPLRSRFLSNQGIIQELSQGMEIFSQLQGKRKLPNFEPPRLLLTGV